MNSEERYMLRAIQLSKKGLYSTYPNPMVGAVIVKDGAIIGEGWHHGPGLPHAEVEALRSCRVDPAGAVMYVSLEPCNHFGRTPPCTEAIIKAGIAAVKIAVADPNPEVSGGGAARLRTAGIKVEEGLVAPAALRLNREYFHHCLTGRPWVILKAALSLDGKITANNGQSQWITGEESRRRTHCLRARAGAVMVGIGTVLADNPRLTNRYFKPAKRQPLKVILDSNLRLTTESAVINENSERLLVFCGATASSRKEAALRRLGVLVYRQNSAGKVNIKEALQTLGGLGVQSILAEGGGTVFTSLMESGLVDEYYLFYAPFFIGGEAAIPVMGNPGVFSLAETVRLEIQSIKRSGEDFLVHAFREKI